MASKSILEHRKRILRTVSCTVRTVMEYPGHKDLATVWLYFAPAEDEPMQKKVSSVDWM
jgi:hypothetical protein